MSRIPNSESRIPHGVVSLVLLGLAISSCLEFPAKGRLGEPCFENGQCTESLKCSDGVCADATEDAGPHASDAGADREITVVYPDAGPAKDTGGPRDRGVADDAEEEDSGAQDDGGGKPDGGPEAEDDAGQDDTGVKDDGGPATGDGGDAGAEDAGEPDTGTPDAGDPCAEFICLCDSYCIVESGSPRCVAGCARPEHCCVGKTCGSGQCK